MILFLAIISTKSVDLKKRSRIEGKKSKEQKQKKRTEEKCFKRS